MCKKTCNTIDCTVKWEVFVVKMFLGATNHKIKHNKILNK